jgi:hypothetical protein
MVEEGLIGTPGIEKGIVEEGQVLEPPALVDRLGQSGHDPVVPPERGRVDGRPGLEGVPEDAPDPVSLSGKFLPVFGHQFGLPGSPQRVRSGYETLGRKGTGSPRELDIHALVLVVKTPIQEVEHLAHR